MVKHYISTYWNGKQEDLSTALLAMIQARQQRANFDDYNLAIAADYLRARLETMKYGSTVAEREVRIYMGLKKRGLALKRGPGPVSPYSDFELAWMLKGVSDQRASQHWYTPLVTTASRATQFAGDEARRAAQFAGPPGWGDAARRLAQFAGLG